MPRILTCSEHEAMWESVDATRNVSLDHQHGYGLVANAIINGVFEMIDCGTCRWATDTTVEKALGTVGDPTLPDVILPIREGLRTKKGQRPMTKDEKPMETQPKAERRRGTVLVEISLGTCTVTVTLLGDLLDVPAATWAALRTLRDALKTLKAS